MQLHLYITDPIAFAKGDYAWCFAAYGEKLKYATDDLYAGAVDVDIDVDRQTVVQVAREMLNEQEDKLQSEFQTKLMQIEQARQELRAIPHLEPVE